MNSTVSIFRFSDYRAYLKAYLQQLPKRGHGEARKIAHQLSVSSTFISQVLAGDRQFTAEQAQTLSDYLGLTTLESDYMFYLVQLDRAGTASLKTYLREKLKALQAQSEKLANRVEAKKTFSEEEKSVFYSSPLYSAIHLYTSTGNEGRSLDEIMERFELSRTRATELVRFLREANLVIEEGGKYRMGVQSTHVELGSPHLLKHHANWRIKAIQASENLSGKELMYTSQVSLSEKDFESLREQMVKFIKGFLDQVHASPADEVASFNLDWFWIRK